MVIANVLNTYTTVAGLWQYDYGQILRIQGLALPTAVEIHFSLSERGGQAVTRVGTTKDGVTDVVIPDSMLENGDITTDYKIYAFIYLTDSESGQTEYKISMSVKSRPRPEIFEKQEDAELFREAIAEVNKSATSAQGSATKAETAKEESIAAAKEAKQSAEEASTSAQASKTSANASKESADTASSAAKASISAKEIAVSAADSADSNTLAASKSAQEAQTSAEQADTASKSAAQSKQDIQELKTAIDNTAEQIATDRTAVETDKEEVQKAKSAVEDLKGAIEQKSSEAITNIGTAKDNAIKDVNTTKNTAVSAITQEKESAVNAVNEAKDAVVEEINKNENVQQIQKNKDSVEELKKDVDQLNDKKITKFYANNLGETYLQDSDNGKIQDMVLYGKSEQKLYNGYNLFDKDNVLIKNIYVSNSKLRRGWLGIESFVIPCKPNTTYTVSRTKVINKNFIAFSYDGEDVNDKEVISVSNSTGLSVILTTGENDTLIGLYYAWDEDKKADEIAPTIMIEEGSENHPYEPYVGGIPSPNIEYPQEIKSVINPVVKIIGKNLLDVSKIINKTINGVEFTPKTDGALIANGTATDNVTYNIVSNFAIKAGTYAIKGCKAYYRTTNNKTGWFGTDKNTFTVATFDSDALLNILIFIPTGTTISETLKPMLIKGNTDGEFEKYKEQIINLPYTLNSIPVSKNGNVTINGQQYVSDYIDIERGKLIKCVAKEILNTKSGKIDEEYRLAINVPICAKKTSLPCVFSKFIYTNWETCIAGNLAYLKNIKKQNGDMYTAQELKEAEIEFTVLYQLNKQEEIDLTQEEIKAFKELATYYPVTNVSITSDQLDGYTTFNYPISMKNGWDYVKQQLGDTRDYIYDVDKKAQDIDTQSAEAYVNSEYAVALTELEVM